MVKRIAALRDQGWRVTGFTFHRERNTLEEMENLRAQVEVIELNLAEDFEDCFIDHLSLP